MPKAAASLSALELSRITDRGMHPAGDGLYLQIKGPNSRSWIWRYTINGKPRWRGLGSAQHLSLAAARQKRDRERVQVRDGIDVVAERKAARLNSKLQDARAMTFKEAATEYISDRQSTWTNKKHASQWTATLEAYAFPIMGALPVQAIDTPLVLKALRPIWKSKPETASRVRGRIESILSWATVQGYRTGDNPARWRGHLDQALSAKPAAEHFAALPYDRVPEFMAELRQRPAIASRALEVTILTASRTTPILEARWSEFDLNAAVWTVPAAHMKGKRDHRVPLSKRAVAILQGLPRVSDLAFPSVDGRPLSNAAMAAALARLGDYRDGEGRPITVHGTARSTFKDWSRERTNFPDELSEAALAHLIGDATAQAYARGDLFHRRRRLMEAWGDYCTRPLTAAKIVEFRAHG